MVYLLIFLAKMAEVSISTVRSVLVNKGMRTVASLLAGVEITLWLAVTAKVLSGLQQDVWKGVAYGIAYVVGIYMGVYIEDKLALGISRIEIVSEKEKAKEITNALRAKGYGVTSIDSKGRDGWKLVLVVDVQRKNVEGTIELLKHYDGIYVTVSDMRSVKIGAIGIRNV